MLKLFCYDTIRDEKGNIIGYKMEDCLNNRKEVTRDQLKQAMMAGQVEVVNIQIDKAGRLVFKARKQTRYLTKYRKGQNILINFGNAPFVKEELKNKNIKAVIEDVEVNEIPGGANSIWNGIWIKSSGGHRAYCDVNYKVLIEGYGSLFINEEYITGQVK